MKRARIWIALLGVLCALPARADTAAGLFGRGQVQFSIAAGSSTAYNGSYNVLGVGGRYFVSDGLGLGLSYEQWTGSGPTITKVSPSVEYVFYGLAPVKPYIGAFYRHASVQGAPAFNSAGARAGIYFVPSPNVVIGLGMVYEAYHNCQATLYGACTETHTELSLLFGL